MTTINVHCLHAVAGLTGQLVVVHTVQVSPRSSFLGKPLLTGIKAASARDQTGPQPPPVLISQILISP